MSKKIREVFSVCPVCMKKIPASLVHFEDKAGIFLNKFCPEHGAFSVPIWRDKINFDEPL